ncbi:hypothetical protein CG007_02300 [Mesoplasma entomophilum]|uniref:hypothetical protein n=1 Tax=Mesoplasma entomophilum TaxID=2149 RepID=UPI000D03E39E|nr:hypothetical protein [Mesoplasma entomophilum]AVN60436.1 hypothetical protein CG007_02300 [Mesoplasma entomophilum]
MNSIYKKVDNLSRDNRETTFKLVADQILKDFSRGLFRTQDELAKKCFVSKSTITQFAKILECTGFRELQIRLKIEYENNFNKKNTNYSKHLTVREYYISFEKWISENYDFLIDFSDDIKKKEEVFLFPSFQTQYASNFLIDVLEKHDYQANIFNLEKDLNKLKKIEWEKKLVLLILTGRDNGSLKLIYEYLTSIGSEVYIICSTNWKFDNNNTKTMYFDNKLCERKYVDRNFWLINLFKLLEELLITKKY